MPRWNSLDLIPFPHESAFSILMRFAWRNAMRTASLYKMVTGKKYVGSSYFGTSESFYDLKLLINNKFFAETGWDICPQGFQDLCHATAKITYAFFSVILRVCPLCFGYGYHAIWHQLNSLKVCPLHGCQIIDYCSSCGHKLCTYSFSKEFFEDPYMCANCKGPIAGVEIRLEDHLDSQRYMSYFDEEFAAYATWARNARRGLASLRKIHSDYFGIHEYWKWLRVDVFMLQAANILVPLPNYSSEERRGITVIAWRQKMQSLSWDSNAHIADWKRRHKMTRTVYVATLNLLQKWIMQRLVDKKRFHSTLDFFEDRKINLDDWDSAHLAYILIRTFYENADNVTLLEVIAPVGLYFDWQSEFRLNSFQGREPRNGWRALFIGIFAFLYWTIEDKKRSRVLDLRKVRVNLNAVVPTYFIVESENVFCGGMLFPEIPGLPLMPFRQDKSLEYMLPRH